jgi:hypothetical protein
MNNSEFEIFARGCRNSLLLSASRLLGGGDEAEDVNVASMGNTTIRLNELNR